MNADRLTILRNFLVTEVPEEDYHQTGFGFFQNGKLTFACAGGWATQVPAFHELGLRNDNYNHTIVWPKLAGGSEFGGSHALLEFFELTGPEYDHIFLGSANENPYDKFETIRHIDEVLTGQFKGEDNA